MVQFLPMGQDSGLIPYKCLLRKNGDSGSLMIKSQGTSFVMKVSILLLFMVSVTWLLNGNAKKLPSSSLTGSMMNLSSESQVIQSLNI